MTMWNLTMHHGMSDTVENLGAYLRHALGDVMDGQVEYLSVDHGPVKRTGPGIGNSPTKIVTNFSFKDGHAIYFTATATESESMQAPVAAWDERANSGRLVLSVEEILASSPRDDWSDPEYDKLGRTAALCEYRSTPVHVPMSLHTSEELRNGSMLMAHAAVQIGKIVRDAEPLIHIVRHAGIDGRTREVPGARYTLTPAEAVELAHTLLLAVEVAREGTEQEVSL